MIIAWNNRADDASTLTASSEISTLPGSNVQTPHVSQQWQTAAGVKAATLLLDLGSSLSCAALALLGTNFTAAATWRLRGSDSDPTGVTGEKYDSGTISAGAKAGYGGCYLSFTAAAARYWLLNVADATVADNLEVGRLFLGPKWTPTQAQGFGWSVTPNDPSQISKSYGGQKYADERPQTRTVRFTLEFMNEAEMYGNAFAMAHDNGVVRDVLAIHNPAGSYLSEQAVWGLCEAGEPLENYEHQIFRQRFTVEERL